MLALRGGVVASLGSVEPQFFFSTFQEIRMKRTFALFARSAVFGLVSLFTLVLAAGANAKDKTIASRTEEVDGVRLHYLTAGQGPAVILLHGYAETSRMWKPILPQLAERFTVIAPDFPGIGDSAMSWGGLDIKEGALCITGLGREVG